MNKRFTIFSMIALAAGQAAFAFQPMVLDNEAVTAVSANGQWTAAQVAEGTIAIRNLETNKVWMYASDGGSINYFVGTGKVVSNNGIVIGATKTDNAAYWEDGFWHELKVHDTGYINTAGSITPDGSAICGGIGLSDMTLDGDNLMLGPAVWYRQEDGTYGDPVVLPHPRTDFSGRHPQYITAIGISDDGKTVAGQILDFTGFVAQPIVYICDDEGKWTYKLLGMNYINPLNLTFPEWPGGLRDDVQMPTQEWYMTQEQIDAFVEAFNEWDNTGEPPHYEDFMTPEQIEQYNEAMEAYLAIMLPWSEKYNAFMDVYYQVMRSGSPFVFNNERVSPDGKYYLSTCELRDSATGKVKNTPVVFDIETESSKTFPSSTGLCVSDFTDDYTILCYAPAAGADIGTRVAYIIPKMEEPVDLLSFVYDHDEEVGEWMEDMMTHEVAMGLGISGMVDTQDMICSGIPVGSADLSVIACSNSTLSWWDYEDSSDIISFVFPTGISSSGIETPADSGEFGLAMLADGTLMLKGEYTEVEIFDVSGKRVAGYTNPSASVATGLDHGIYIIRAKDSANGIRKAKVMI